MSSAGVWEEETREGWVRGERKGGMEGRDGREEQRRGVDRKEEESGGNGIMCFSSV